MRVTFFLKFILNLADLNSIQNCNGNRNVTIDD